MGTNLAAVLAQLKLENKELQEAVSNIGFPTGCSSSSSSSSSRGRSTVDIEYLERELQRARNKYDAALHSRQQQVAELEELTVRCQEMLQPAGALQGQSAVQHTAAQVEARLNAVGQRVQCAASMQKYLQQAEQQHKQELLEAQSHVQELRDTLLKAQAQLQEAKGKVIIAKASRAKSQGRAGLGRAWQGLAAAEQQLLAGRAQRSRLKHQLCQSSQMISQSTPDVVWTWDHVQQLCAAVAVHTSTAPPPIEQLCMAQTATHIASLSAAAAETAAECGRLFDSHDEDVDASGCLEKALRHFKCGSAQELVQFVEAQIQAAESLNDATLGL